MRPLPGDDAHARPRTSDPHGPSTFRLPTAPQMTYVLGDESAIGSSSQPPPAAHPRSKDHRAVPPADVPEHHPKPRVPSHHDFDRHKEPSSRPSSSRGLRHFDDDLSRPLSPFPRSTDTPSLSQPLTPVLLGASGPASALSSVSSRRNSLCLSEDLPSCPPSMKDGDIAVEDDDDDDEEGDRDDGGRDGQDQTEQHLSGGSSMMDSGSAPQLIMPSIKMPSRRPFTDEGKRMGRLKVLVAGDSGVGKTSLIKAIVQSCEHIVHVDPITPSALLASSVTRSLPSSTVGGLVGGGRQKMGGRRSSARESQSSGGGGGGGTSQITEIYASTKPYPEWWSEVDDFRVLRRRKSLGDAVLDRNICFVDTPGYGSGSSSMDTITPVAQYIEAHLQRMNSNFLSDGDILNLLGGEGGVQVDAVFYLVSNRLRPVDIEYLRQLSPLTNILILLAQTDLMSADQVAASKSQIHCQLKEADIRLFSFSMPSHFPASDPDRQGIYAISSATGSDHDTMDASLLMSPDYVQPLIPTELATLVSHVFTSNGVSWLRHSVARKYVQWRKSSFPSPSTTPLSSPRPQQQQPPSLPRSQTLPASIAPSSSSSSFFFPTNPHYQQQQPNNSHHHHHHHILSHHPHPTRDATATSNYALARLADHAQREERLAQRSLARERAQYAALARAERAAWLPRASGRAGEKSQGQSQSQSQRHRQDPLGLLEVAAELRHKGLIALEVLGSLGVLGGLALWVTRHYLHLQPCGWSPGSGKGSGMARGKAVDGMRSENIASRLRE
ncbi:hypothetical protein NEMBOFW57_000361 [Staphylotrichum longicolle]|uniref:Septin-type G domain-containing protein n=1 Tax=Staphylotrichum longicolle TaxID=669026 RepID=A0AAD4EZM1_9PEZI|nr:hypothetical protein NEMBOFW57_000361 [Staphylotrichum longicolle]